jgi:predicted signal transduction protein with EAL and GGDEF domain
VIDDRVVATTASIGVAVCPHDSIDADELSRAAAIALAAAKSEGCDTCRLYAAEMAENLSARCQIGRDLARAISDDQLTLHYQPLFSIGTGHIVGFEALLRRNHPERGRIPPAEFIPIAEETGLIVAIGRWVLNCACADAARWPADCRLAVNLSAVQFRAMSLVDDVRSALEDSGLDPRRLELEVTETALLSGTERTIGQLRELHTLGLSIAMDDFGTGYPSLGYLRTAVRVRSDQDRPQFRRAARQRPRQRHARRGDGIPRPLPRRRDHGEGRRDAPATRGVARHGLR